MNFLIIHLFLVLKFLDRIPGFISCEFSFCVVRTLSMKLQRYQSELIHDRCVFFYFDIFNHPNFHPFLHNLLTDQFISFVTTLFVSWR